MLNYAIYILLISLLCDFIIVVLDKFGILELLQVSRYKLISKLANCKFCLGFWLSLIFSIVLVIIFKDIIFVFIPIFVAPIVKLL